MSDDIPYILRVLKYASPEKFMTCARACARESGKHTAAIVADMLVCARLYGAGYNDYQLFRFWDLTADERESHMTRLRNQAFVDRMNDLRARREIFGRKTHFYQRFDSYLGRAWLKLANASADDLLEFVSERGVVVAKPDVGLGGHGIEIVRLEDFDTHAAFVDYLRSESKGFGVIEELLVQHADLSCVYPAAVNTIRMTTIVAEDGPKLLYALMKFGAHGAEVDNVGSGGYACHVDCTTGAIMGPGHACAPDDSAEEGFSDAATVLADAHPQTGVVFRDFVIPCFCEAREDRKSVV